MTVALSQDDQAVLRRVDRACDRFEAAWKTGPPPRIEAFLDEVPGPDRAALLHELVPLDVLYRRRGGEQPSPGEYRLRFPDLGDVIDAVFPTPMPPPAPAPPGDGRARPSGAGTAADSNLLFGILALQLDFVGRDELIAAMHAWVLDKDRPLGRILLEQRVLDAEAYAVLETVVRKHLERHGDAPRRSLAALSALGPVRQDLEHLADAELSASLARVGTAAAGADAYDTVVPPAGEPTADGLRFAILRLHARGGLGVVFEARDRELNRKVALKEIQDQHADHPDRRARFLLEAEVTGRLEHPGIVPVYGLGRYPDGRPFYAMRFIRGETFKEGIKRLHEEDVPGRDPGERTVAFRKLLGRFVAVCDAIAYAHSRGVIHRDIKPHNIMLGPFGETLVVDWGLAKPIDRRASGEAREEDEEPLVPASRLGAAGTLAGSTLGTPAFMSPEQAGGRGDQLGPASDVYSLGASLYYLLTGQAAFQGTPEWVVEQVRRGAFPPPRRLCPGIDRALEAICLKAMALQPEDRYDSARALAEDVERWLADEPVSAYREPRTRRLKRWTRRHRGEVRGGAAALLALILMTAAIHHARRVEAVQEAQASLARFRRGYDQALALATQFIGLDPAPSRAAIRDALAAAGVTEDGTGEPVVPDLLEDHREEMTAGCFELLLLLAEAEAPTPVSGADPGPRDRAERALGLLGRAARLGRTSWTYHLQRANYLDRLGETTAAEDSRRRARGGPSDAFDHFHLGMLSLFQGDLAAALPLFERALELRPADFWSRYHVAICLLKLERPAEARAHLTACIGQRPDFPWSYVVRGYALGELGQAERAEADFRTALGLRPDDSARYAILVNRGRMRLLCGRLEEAHDDLEAAIALLPGRHEAYVNRAQVYRAQQQWDAAVAQLDRAIELAPDLAGPYRNRARVRIEQGDSAAVMDDLEQAIRREAAHPRDLAEDHTDRGLILHRAGRYEGAVAAHDAALAAQPEMALAHRLRAEALMELGRDEEAIAALDRALGYGKPDKPDADAYRLRGLLRMRLHQTAGAMEDFTRALEIEPDSSNMHTKRGWSYLLEGWALALRDFDRALEINPANSDAHAGRGYALVQLGRSGEGVEAAEQAVHFAPEEPDLLYNAACVYAQAAGKAQDDGDLAARYGARSLDLIRQALKLLPPEKRASFWREAIAPDAALDPIRNTAGFARLEAEYGRSAP